jgi:hypothetical protein
MHICLVMRGSVYSVMWDSRSGSVSATYFSFCMQITVDYKRCVTAVVAVVFWSRHLCMDAVCLFVCNIIVLDGCFTKFCDFFITLGIFPTHLYCSKQYNVICMSLSVCLLVCMLVISSNIHFKCLLFWISYSFSFKLYTEQPLPLLPKSFPSVLQFSCELYLMRTRDLPGSCNPFFFHAVHLSLFDVKCVELLTAIYKQGSYPRKIFLHTRRSS